MQSVMSWCTEVVVGFWFQGSGSDLQIGGRNFGPRELEEWN